MVNNSDPNKLIPDAEFASKLKLNFPPRVLSETRIRRVGPKTPPIILEFDDSMRAIPISAAKQIADKYGYDQVVIIARRVGDNGGEHCTTYGKTKEHCDIAAKIGDFLKYKVMGWTNE